MPACQICAKSAPVAQVSFKQNIGMLLMRKEKSMSGRLCHDCASKTFWSYTLTTLFLGWWGTISFVLTPVYIFMNVSQFVRARSQYAASQS